MQSERHSAKITHQSSLKCRGHGRLGKTEELSQTGGDWKDRPTQCSVDLGLEPGTEKGHSWSRQRGQHEERPQAKQDMDPSTSGWRGSRPASVSLCCTNIILFYMCHYDKEVWQHWGWGPDSGEHSPPSCFYHAHWPRAKSRLWNQAGAGVLRGRPLKLLTPTPSGPAFIWGRQYRSYLNRQQERPWDTTHLCLNCPKFHDLA